MSNPPFLSSQDQFLCLAVVQGRLKVFYDFNGEMAELPPKAPSLDLKISNADPKAVRSRVLCSFPSCLFLLLFIAPSCLPLQLLLLLLLYPPAGDHHPEERPQSGGGEEQPGGALQPPIYPGDPSLQWQLLLGWRT